MVIICSLPAVIILEALSKISSVTGLHLLFNQLTENLASVICNNVGLKQLLLDNNNFGKGMSHIVRALQQH